MFPMHNYSNVSLMSVFPEYSVYLAQETSTKRNVELIVSNYSVQENSKLSLIEEVKLLQKLQGIEGIPELYHNGYTSTQKFYQVIQYTGHNLHELIQGKKQLGATMIIYIGQQLLGIFERIHALNIFHTDLNPRNINILKATVFLRGFSTVSQTQQNTKAQSNIRFISKSIFNNQTPTYKDDLESLGYLLIYLVNYEINNQIINNQISSAILFRKYFQLISQSPLTTPTNYLHLKKLIYVIISNCLNTRPKLKPKKNFSPKNQRFSVRNLSVIKEDDLDQIVSRNFVKINFKLELENQLDQNYEISEEDCQISEMLQNLHTQTIRARSIASLCSNGLQA